jgi:hypothetical protein
MLALQNHAQHLLGRAAQAADRLRAQRLVHAGAGQHFPVYQHARRRLGNEIRLIQIPEVMVAEDYASMATLFMVFVQLIPAFCMVAIILLCARVRLPLGLKEWMARVLFQFKTWAWWKFSSPGCWSASSS